MEQFTMPKETHKRVLLTGPPGIGKTTVIKKVCSALKEKNIPVRGFYTDELKNEFQKRIGFDVVSVDGKRHRLSRTLYKEEVLQLPPKTLSTHVIHFLNQIIGHLQMQFVQVSDYLRPGDSRMHKLGQYYVFLEAFEKIIAPLFAKEISNGVLVIDEIGKMELFSTFFEDLVKNAFAGSDMYILATVPVLKGNLPLVESIIGDTSNKLITVNQTNRNRLVDVILPYFVNADLGTNSK